MASRPLKSGHFDLLRCQKLVKFIFLYSWPHRLYKSFKFSTHIYEICFFTPVDIFVVGQFWPSGVLNHSEGRDRQNSLPPESFPNFFYMFLDSDLKLGIHPVCGTTNLVWVSSHSGQFHLHHSHPGLGRVHKSWVRVRVLLLSVSTSTSTEKNMWVRVWVL